MIDDPPLFQPTPLQRRMIDAAVEIEECTPETIEFLHSVLCQVGLPRSSTKERIFERNNGKVSIRVEAGALYKGGKWIEQQLPYGESSGSQSPGPSCFTPRIGLTPLEGAEVTSGAAPRS